MSAAPLPPPVPGPPLPTTSSEVKSAGPAASSRAGDSERGERGEAAEEAAVDPGTMPTMRSASCVHTESTNCAVSQQHQMQRRQWQEASRAEAKQRATDLGSHLQRPGTLGARLSKRRSREVTRGSPSVHCIKHGSKRNEGERTCCCSEGWRLWWRLVCCCRLFCRLSAAARAVAASPITAKQHTDRGIRVVRYADTAKRSDTEQGKAGSPVH